MTKITRKDREAAEEICRNHAMGFPVSAQTAMREEAAAIISRHTRDGELREALKKVCDSDWTSHLKAIADASALLAALDAEEGGKDA